MLSELIVAYLFFGGAGSGACLVACVLCAFVPYGSVVSRRGNHASLCVPIGYRRLLAPPFAASVLCFLAGTVCLLVDLGRPDKLILLVLSPRLTFIVIGMWSIILAASAAIANGVIWAGFVRRASHRLLRIFEICGVFFSLIAMSYTGLFLWQMGNAIPFWSSPLLPLLFVVSSLSSGVAIVVAFAAITGAGRVFRSVIHRLMLFDIVFLLVELTVTACLLLWALSFRSQAYTPLSAAVLESANILLFGSQASLFWGGFVGVGLVCPLLGDVAFALRKAYSTQIMLLLVSCVLVGSAIFRWCIVAAGGHPVPMAGV